MVESLFVQFLELLLPILKNGETLSAEEISFLQYSKSKVGLIQVNFDAVTIDYSEIRAFLLKTRSEAVKSLLGRCIKFWIPFFLAFLGYLIVTRAYTNVQIRKRTTIPSALMVRKMYGLR